MAYLNNDLLGFLGKPFEGMNIFGAKPSATTQLLAKPTSEGGYGLLSQDMLQKAEMQSLGKGLLTTLASYLAQPKNKGYGSALPYLAGSYLEGMTAAQKPFEGLQESALNNLKLDEYNLSKQKEQRRQNWLNTFGAKDIGTISDADLQEGVRVGEITVNDYFKIKESQKTEPIKLSNEADRLASSMFSKNYGRSVTFSELTPEQQQQVDKELVNREIQTEQAKGLGEARGKSMSAYQDKIDESGDTAYDRIQDLNQLEALLSNVDAGGMGEETYTQFQSLLQNFGLGKDELVGNKQASIAISNRLAKALRKPGEGVMTDADFRVLKESVPGLSQTPEGRAFLINSIRKMSEREMEIQDMAYKYLETNPSLDNNFKRQLLEFRRNNPVFTKEELVFMQGSKQIKKQPGSTTKLGTTAPSSKEFESTDQLILDSDIPTWDDL